MESVLSQYEHTIGEEMQLNHAQDPFWRRTYILKCIDRWENLILNSGIKLALPYMVDKALTHDMLMWPIGRMAFSHDDGCEEVELDREFTSKSILDHDLLLKILRLFLSEPELTAFIKREERKPLLTSWYDTKFAWVDTDGKEIRLTNFIVKFSDFCLKRFFEANHEEGYSSAQLYVFTQFRRHDVSNCTRSIPFTGLTAIQKTIPFEDWSHVDGHTYSDDSLREAVTQIRSHFEAMANRPSIPPMTFNLN